MKGDGTSDSIRSWEAADWEELLTVWNELVPGSEDPDTEPIRRFRGSELSPQEAGQVF